MKPDQVKNSLAVIMPLVFTVSCGGGDGSTASTPDIGEAIPSGNAIEQTINGRVADGYLQGAIVCVDLNENGQCDPDEPQVESGEGGSYSLDLPASSLGKPVLAEVPATAIDEDTGMPIGKELVLSTPGDKPEFVSPITTLVHQELKNNPNLNTEDAAASVLETLGLPDEEDASLFTDYIAESDGTDDQRRDKFEFLHQTARVVASMMDEIHTNVETAASTQGIDVDSEATAAAIRDLVREEIRSQLPDISAAVAERIQQIEGATQSGDDEQLELTDEFDPDSISRSLGESDLTKDIAEKIEAAKDEAPVERANMNDLLAAGIYIIDIDCERYDDYGPEDGLVKPAVDQYPVMLNDEGVPEIVDMPEYCTAEYTHVMTETLTESTADVQADAATAVDGTVPAASNLVVSHFYYGFDEATGSNSWIMDEQTREERPHLLTLANGDWIPVQNEGPYGVVEFTADGGAIMNTDEGKLLVYASSRDLSGKSVLHHVLNRGAGDDLAGLIDESKNFPDDSSVHQLNIKRSASLMVMYNWYPETDDTDIDYCADFGGNCNVVYVKDDASYSYTPLASLGDLYDGAVIDAVAHDNMEHLPIDVALHLKPADEQASKVNGFADETGSEVNNRPGGIAAWTVSPQQFGIEPAPGSEPDPSEQEYCVEENTYSFDGTDLVPADEVGDAIPYCPQEIDHVQMVCVDESQNQVTVMVPADYAKYSADVQQAITETQGVLANGEVVSVPDCPLPPRENKSGVAQNDVTADAAAVEYPRSVVIGESRWYTASVQGVDMIVIEVPVSVRHRMDEDEMAELLLIQNGEFVRRGARIGEHSVDDETAYNVKAFETLLPIIADYIEPQSEQTQF